MPLKHKIERRKIDDIIIAFVDRDYKSQSFKQNLLLSVKSLQIKKVCSCYYYFLINQKYLGEMHSLIIVIQES